jgi:hypothetical protein
MICVLEDAFLSWLTPTSTAAQTMAYTKRRKNSKNVGIGDFPIFCVRLLQPAGIFHCSLGRFGNPIARSWVLNPPN